MQTEADRVRGYLVTQAAKLSVPELVDKLRHDVLPLRDVARRVPPERFRERPAGGEWSAAEVFTHILDMTEFGDVAIGTIVAGGRAPARVRDVVSGEARGGLETAETTGGRSRRCASRSTPGCWNGAATSTST